MKAATIKAFVSVLAFEAFAAFEAADTQPNPEADGTKEACQSGSLIQHSSPSRSKVPEPVEAVEPAMKEMKKAKKAKKAKKVKKETHSDLLGLLAEFKKEGLGHSEGSECQPKGAVPSGERKAQFEQLSQKAFTLDLDPVIARLVKKDDYVPRLAKRAADEYRRFLVLMGMGEAPVPSKMVVDAWQAHIMYTKMYERDCQEVFGRLLEHDPLLLGQDAERLEQTQQQICDYFGVVDRLVWSASSPSKPVALSESMDPAVTMDQWLDHINEPPALRKGLLAEDVHLMVASEHDYTAIKHRGREEALSFFQHYNHATRFRKFLSEDKAAFALEIAKHFRMGVDVFEVDSDGKISDVKIFMATLWQDLEDLNDTGLANLTMHTVGNGSTNERTLPPQGLVQVGETGNLTKAAMEAWMHDLNEVTEEKEDLLADDVRLVLMTQLTAAPEIHEGKPQVEAFFRDWEHGAEARAFLSTDGGAFMVEVKHGPPQPRMAAQVFEVSDSGKIHSIKIWVASLNLDEQDLNDNGLTSVSLLASGSAEPAGPEPTECLRSSSRPSLQQMQRFNASAEKVKALDLDAVVSVLVEKDKYTPGKAAELTEEYRKYLALASSGHNPVPSKKVDDAWHAHILNTKKYQADTKSLFGQVLHHEPANLLLEQQGMREQKSSMDNMLSHTKMQLCDYYGRVDEAVWSKDSKSDLALCSCGCMCSCGCACACACACMPAPSPSPSPSPSGC